MNAADFRFENLLIEKAEIKTKNESTRPIKPVLNETFKYRLNNIPKTNRNVI